MPEEEQQEIKFWYDKYYDLLWNNDNPNESEFNHLLDQTPDQVLTALNELEDGDLSQSEERR